jgi:hypothetical protein
VRAQQRIRNSKTYTRGITQERAQSTSTGVASLTGAEIDADEVSQTAGNLRWDTA